MSSPGSQSPKHPEFQNRLAHLRTAGRWDSYSIRSSKELRNGTIVTLFSSSKLAVGLDELNKEAEQMRRDLKSLKAQGATISGDVMILAKKNMLRVVSAVIVDPADMERFKAADFINYPMR